MTRPGRYPQELRERAVRLVLEHQDEYPAQWAAISSIAHKFGVSAETLRKWVRRAETDDGLRPGLTSDEHQRLKTLERENRELRRANEILKSAAVHSIRQRNTILVEVVGRGEVGTSGDVGRTETAVVGPMEGWGVDERGRSGGDLPRPGPG